VRGHVHRTYTDAHGNTETIDLLGHKIIDACIDEQNNQTGVQDFHHEQGSLGGRAGRQYRAAGYARHEVATGSQRRHQRASPKRAARKSAGFFRGLDNAAAAEKDDRRLLKMLKKHYDVQTGQSQLELGADAQRLYTRLIKSHDLLRRRGLLPRPLPPPERISFLWSISLSAIAAAPSLYFISLRALPRTARLAICSGRE
jgi:hypothetical protein